MIAGSPGKLIEIKLLRLKSGFQRQEVTECISLILQHCMHDITYMYMYINSAADGCYQLQSHPKPNWTYRLQAYHEIKLEVSPAASDLFARCWCIAQSMSFHAFIANLHSPACLNFFFS